MSVANSPPTRPLPVRYALRGSPFWDEYARSTPSKGCSSWREGLAMGALEKLDRQPALGATRARSIRIPDVCNLS
jgi:hypothetical protein